MSAKTVSLMVIASLLSAVLLAVASTLPPLPLPADAPVSEFSAERAIEHIQVVAKEPHPTGSTANQAVRDYILAELQELGLETATQRDGELENVMGWIAGSESRDAVLLTAHLDSTLQSPGASDDASGVAVLLETARALISDPPTRNTVIFLFTDHEEGGWFGAKAFIASHPWVKDVKVVIGFDAGGVSGLGVLSATSADNGWLIRQLIQADPYFVGSSAINALADSRTDFGHAFKPAGFSGYAFDFYWDKRDGSEDNLETLNPPSVQHQGYHATSLARHFANLSHLDDPKEPDLVYFTFLRVFVMRYPPNWAVLSAIVVAGVFSLVLVYGFRRRLLSWAGMGYGMLVVLVGLAIAPLPSLVLDLFIGRWIPGVSADWDYRLVDQLPQMSLIALTSLGLVIIWYALSGKVRKTSLPDLTLGALIPIAAGMLASSFAFPALSYGFTWPLSFSLLACANWFYWQGDRLSSLAILLGLLASGASSVVIVAPAILLGLFDKLGLALVSLGALCGFLVPQIHLMISDAIWKIDQKKA